VGAELQASASDPVEPGSFETLHRYIEVSKLHGQFPDQGHVAIDGSG
jgi:hypothetical protein